MDLCLNVLEKLREVLVSPGIVSLLHLSALLSFFFFLIVIPFLVMLSLRGSKMAAAAPACTLLGPVLGKKRTHFFHISTIHCRKKMNMGALVV